MALDAGLYPQDSFGYVCKELYALGSCGYQFGLQEADDKAFVAMLDNCMEPQSLQYLNWEQNVKEIDHNSSPEACMGDPQVMAEASPVVEAQPPLPLASSGRRKRRRTRCCKNKEELENQRMTHIAVERNRRKQMNEYLAVIRSLMPASYVQRGDQASIIAGAINFVKELEQHVQNLEAQKRAINQETSNINNVQPPLFADFFTFPQYSTQPNSSSPLSTTSSDPMAEKNRSALADIEVTMVESHANLKILSKRQPRQLLKIVAGLQCLWLTILHLNVTTTVDQMVLYSLSVKLEEECQLTTVDEIADAVHHLLGRIQEEAML